MLFGFFIFDKKRDNEFYKQPSFFIDFNLFCAFLHDF